MNRVLALFPGMATSTPGMAAELTSSPAARAVFEEFARASGADVLGLACNADGEELRRDRNCELATVATHVAALAAHREKGGRIDAALGFSIGAYAALACAGVISPVQIVIMIDIVLRASLELEGSFAMLAVLGIARADVEAACVGAPVQLSAVLGATHTLVAGTEDGIATLTRRLSGRDSKLTRLAVRWPLHTALMRPVAERLRAARASVGRFAEPRMPVYSLYHADRIDNGEQAWELLVEHLHAVQRLDLAAAAALRDGYLSAVELGPGTTLSRGFRRLARDLGGAAAWAAREVRPC